MVIFYVSPIARSPRTPSVLCLSLAIVIGIFTSNQIREPIQTPEPIQKACP